MGKTFLITLIIKSWHIIRYSALTLVTPVFTVCCSKRFNVRVFSFLVITAYRAAILSYCLNFYLSAQSRLTLAELY